MSEQIEARAAVAGARDLGGASAVVPPEEHPVLRTDDVAPESAEAVAESDDLPDVVAAPGSPLHAAQVAAGVVTPESPAELGGPDLDQPAPPSTPGRRGRLRAFAGILGPGLVSGVADDDPSGVATYSQAGAQTGVQLLWMAPVSLPLMYAVQEICDRTALATGDSLGTLVRRKFTGHGRWVIGVLLVALLVANCLNIAADLAAIGQGMQLLGLGPDHVWAAVAGVALTVALILGSFERIAAVFKWLCIVLVVYLAVLFVANVPWAEVGAGTVGLRMQWNWATAGLIVAVLGTTISPYIFFWQSAHRIEEMRVERVPTWDAR